MQYTDDEPEPWDEETWRDDEEDDEDEDEDEETAVLACPSCGGEVYEDAERCPLCGDYIVRRLRAWEGRPTWWIVIGLVGIVAVILWLL